MSESEGLEVNGGKLQDFTIDQAAGALALGLVAISFPVKEHRRPLRATKRNKMKF